MTELGTPHAALRHLGQSPVRPSAPFGEAAFLGVERSLSGRRWLGPDAGTLRLMEALMQRTGLPGAVCAVLARLGVRPDAVNEYLEPRLRSLLPDPMTLRDMDRAAERIVRAVLNRERIAVFADYDVDGGASAALLLDWLRALGRQATLYIPDRIDEGYGPNPAAMATLAHGHDLIVCVDCGTNAHEALAAARGADVVVLDHHLAGPRLPPAVAVVNPNRADEDGTLGHLCAAGVVFLALVEANRRLRRRGLGAPELLAAVDLVALATVADMVPLIGVNRAFVQQGLRVMAARVRPGLVALADSARLARPPTVFDLGFVLGPRINAGGRVGRADLGARLLAATDSNEALRLAEELEALNAARRAIEAEVRDAAFAEATKRGLDGPLVWAAGEGWHPGVIGIVAARLKELAERPAVVVGLEGEAGKGSGRSIAGVDLGRAVHRLVDEGLLTKGGGHPMAAGLTVSRDKLEAAMERLHHLLAKQGAEHGERQILELDGLLTPSAFDVELVSALRRVGPFGQAVSPPRFAFASLRLTHVFAHGKGHVRLRLSDEAGNLLDAVAFGAAERPLGRALLRAEGALLHVVGRLETNHKQGRERPELHLDDAAFA